MSKKENLRAVFPVISQTMAGKPVIEPFVCLIHPVISKFFVARSSVVVSSPLVNSTNILVQQPSSDTPPTTGLEDSDPLFSRGFFLSLLLSCSLPHLKSIFMVETLE
jgi:hypothetical protein